MKVVACLYCGYEELAYVTHRSDNNGILRCVRCKVMMVENMSDDNEALYTSEYFEKDEKTKIGYTNYLSSPAVNLIGKYGFVRLFARQIGSHLDLGCADGSLMEIFSSAGFKSRGLEISKDAVAIANTKGLDVSYSRLHSFPNGLEKSNVITAFDLLEHTDQPGSVLKEVYENLEDNGYFVFSTLAVTRNDPSDYWFNNSLEHYIYYDHVSLEFILSEVFGKSNFSFVEINIHGVAEFWGFAKKGSLLGERKIIDNVVSGAFDKQDHEAGYFVSLFYDQLSKFTESQKVIKHFAKTWSAEKLMLAQFYNAFYQGKYEKALEIVEVSQNYISANDAVYWQALAFVREQFYDIRDKDIVAEYNIEVNSLRQKLFESRRELHNLKKSQVIGRAIIIGDKIGEFYFRTTKSSRPYRYLSRIHHAPSIRQKVLVVGAPLVPPHLRVRTKQFLRDKYKAIQRLSPDTNPASVSEVEVTNKRADGDGPLVSVVIPYYNLGSTIEETIASLKKQTFVNFEVIIIDDGSTNKESIKKLKQLNFDGLMYKIVHQSNQGVAATRNNGINLAQGAYICCLDSDDILSPAFIEKAVYVLETQPDTSLITTHVNIFGSINEVYKNVEYNPVDLYSNNMVITAAVFRRSAWASTAGYKPNIGYEDWEFWLNLAEVGNWGKLIPEQLFYYRTSLKSRYVEDKDQHWNSMDSVRALHPNYIKKVTKLLDESGSKQRRVAPPSAFINLDQASHFSQRINDRPNVMITMPWMTFGGAETLVLNYCQEVKDNINITFVTGLHSDNEWEYKFRRITPNIYHLPNLFDDPKLYIEFVSNYISTHKIDILHLVHNGFMFDMLPTIKERHPNIRVILTLFNDRVPDYVDGAIKYQTYIDRYVTDNQAVATSISERLTGGVTFDVIPNGINAYDEFNPDLYDRGVYRRLLNLNKNDLAVFFVGRLSSEKNPDVFIKAAELATAAMGTKRSLKFFLVGDGHMRQDIEQLIKVAKTQNITLLGYQAEVASYLSAADILVLPSSIEGFPLTIIEAMAMGVVVIASDVGAVSEVIDSEKDGFVVQPGSADEIADKLTLLARDTRKLIAMKKLVRKKIEQYYSNRILGVNYKRLYDELTK